MDNLIVDATDFKNKFGEYLKEIYTKKERVTIEKSKLPVLVVMSYQDYEEMTDTLEAFLMYSKPEILRQVEEGEKDIRSGNGINLQQMIK